MGGKGREGKGEREGEREKERRVGGKGREVERGGSEKGRGGKGGRE